MTGIDDLLVASYSGRSRNYLLGHMMGEGYSFNQIKERFGHITFEGIKTVKMTYELALKLAVQTPLVESVHTLVEGATPPRDAFDMFWSKMDAGRDVF